MVEHSAEINELAAALSKAQAAVKGAIKDSDNPAFKREGKVIRYADLESVKDACWGAAMGNDLAILQFPGLTIDGVMHLTTMLTHKSGQWIRDTMSIPLAKVDAQGYGSAVTYARRYSLAALMGVTPEDDDGNAASNPSGADNSRHALPDGPAPREKLEGMFSSMTALKAAYMQLDRDIRACESVEELDGFLELDRSKAIISQLEQYAKGYVVGSDKLPKEHVALIPLIAQCRAQLGAQEDDNAWRTNYFRAG